MSGSITDVSGILVGELQIWSQPWRATSDLADYRAAFPSTMAGLDWQLRPTLHGVEVAIVEGFEALHGSRVIGKQVQLCGGIFLEMNTTIIDAIVKPMHRELQCTCQLRNGEKRFGLRMMPASIAPSPTLSLSALLPK